MQKKIDFASDIPSRRTFRTLPHPNFASSNTNTMSATDQKQKLGGHTQLFGEQLVTLKDLHEFKNELLLEVKKSLKDNAGQPTKKWLKTHEVRKLLGVSITTLLTLRINGILPYSKIGGCLYFDYEDILKVMDQHKRHHAY
ncbi:Helix-turn-helix domain-containing protein [Mucilaginibacter gossypiicola]|uniref:Helix-turn-helix domain-containing protein n=2 Tax=Mucilaginibacter gossypiicola TaxID=551995 RepID=A0A1H8DB73_9SPHI|nr:Helix-turn-helix domain-containing protein [Mucilaginibacter gossypiicola]